MNQQKQFFQYVIPAVGAMLVTGLYFVVDGIFVGRGVGAEALAAVNIAVPYISILTAISMMVTMGGATLTAMLWKRRKRKSQQYVPAQHPAGFCFLRPDDGH